MAQEAGRSQVKELLRGGREEVARRARGQAPQDRPIRGVQTEQQAAPTIKRRVVVGGAPGRPSRGGRPAAGPGDGALRWSRREGAALDPGPTFSNRTAGIERRDRSPHLEWQCPTRRGRQQVEADKEGLGEGAQRVGQGPCSRAPIARWPEAGPTATRSGCRGPEIFQRSPESWRMARVKDRERNRKTSSNLKQGRQRHYPANR